METVVLALIIGSCGILAGRKMLRDLGVLKGGDDCGCGKCRTKPPSVRRG